VQIQPLYLTVGNLLAGRLFKVPEYQRAYSWQTKQREDLFRDIEKVSESGSDSTHFMATVVGLRRKKKRIASDEFQEIEVVDGQQRLTTLTILLKAISKQMNEDDPRRAEEINSILVKGDDLALLVTNHDINHIFADYLREGAVPDGKALRISADQNLVDAISECEQFVADWTGERKRKLINLYSIVKNQLYAILFEIEDEGAVYTVFEVLNSRGLDVTWFDKLKSLLMAVVFEAGSTSTKLDAISSVRSAFGVSAPARSVSNLSDHFRIFFRKILSRFFRSLETSPSVQSLFALPRTTCTFGAFTSPAAIQLWSVIREIQACLAASLVV
jgi:Protein of unknown function DUF262